MNLLRLSCWGHLRSEDVGDRGHDLLRRRHTLDFDITAWRWGGWGVGSRTTIRLGFLPLSRRQPHCTRRCARDLGAQLLCHNRAGGAVTASHETFFKCQSLQLARYYAAMDCMDAARSRHLDGGPTSCAAKNTAKALESCRAVVESSTGLAVPIFGSCCAAA